MFGSIKLAFLIAKQNRIECKLEKMQRRLSVIIDELTQSAIESLNTDLTEINDKEIKESYEDCDKILELAKMIYQILQ